MSEFRFNANGALLWALETGQGDPLILLHGAGGTHHACLSIAAPLQAQFRVFTPDLRGSGKSWSDTGLSWDQLADDIGALLDHIGADRAVVGGVSSGTGAAIRFALRTPARTAALILITPPYGGEQRGLTDFQANAFRGMDELLANAGDEGVEALRPLYQHSPAMKAYFDAVVNDLDFASLAATSQFMASGAQPFSSAADLATISVPTLLVPGNDSMHPVEFSNLYAKNIPRCTVLVPAASDSSARNAEIGSAISDFCSRNATW